MYLDSFFKEVFAINVIILIVRYCLKSYSPNVRNEPKIAYLFPAVWAVVHVVA